MDAIERLVDLWRSHNIPPEIMLSVLDVMGVEQNDSMSLIEGYQRGGSFPTGRVMNWVDPCLMMRKRA